MATQTARALTVGADGIAKVYSAGLLVEGTSGGVFSGEAVWLSSDISGTGDWYFELNGHQVTSVSFPHLLSVSAYLDFGSNRISSVSAPVLTQIPVGGFFYFYNNPIASVYVPMLRTIIGAFRFTQSSSLSGEFRSLDLPSLTTIGDDTNTANFLFTNHASLSEVSMPVLSVAKKANITITGCALSNSCVNNLLIRLNAANTGADLVIDLSGGTSAAPTGAGITAKNALIANGSLVTTN